MITFIKGNIFETPAKVLVNTVNTVGVMGKGIAKTFKEIYPEMFSRYQKICEAGEFNVGQLWLHKTPNKWILNFPTKQHWRQSSQPAYIEAGLKKFISGYAIHGINSIAFPRLGCGNGDLDWEKTVRPLMLKYLNEVSIDIFIYDFASPSELPEHKSVDEMRQWLRNDPQVLPFSEVWDDLKSVLSIGKDLTLWQGSQKYKASISGDGSGIRIEKVDQSIIEKIVGLVPYIFRPKSIGDGKLWVPREAILDLWQTIRGYGFCSPRTFPSGLEEYSPYLLPIMETLEYLKPVSMATVRQDSAGQAEIGLRLVVAPSKIERSVQIHSMVKAA